MKHALYFFAIAAIYLGYVTSTSDVLEIYPQDVTTIHEDRGMVEIYGENWYVGYDNCRKLRKDTANIEVMNVIRIKIFSVPIYPYEAVIFTE